jgi:hypothetical protein
LFAEEGRGPKLGAKIRPGFVYKGEQWVKFEGRGCPQEGFGLEFRKRGEMQACVCAGEE